MFCSTQQCSNRWSFIFKTQQRNGGYATDFSAEHCLDKFSLQQRGSHNSHNRIFDVPDNQSPQASILNLANGRWNMKDKKATAAALHDYRVCPFHATTTQACIFCCKTLSASLLKKLCIVIRGHSNSTFVRWGRGGLPKTNNSYLTRNFSYLKSEQGGRGGLKVAKFEPTCYLNGPLSQNRHGQVEENLKDITERKSQQSNIRDVIDKDSKICCIFFGPPGMIVVSTEV